MTNTFFTSVYMIANAWNDSRFTATRMQQHPLSYAIWQQLKNTCNCTHKFHFPPEFAIIYCQEKKLLKRNFSKCHAVNTANRELLQPPAIFSPLAFTKSSTFSAQNSWELEQKRTDQDHKHRLTEEFQELSTRVCFHGCGRTVYITAVGGREPSIMDNIWHALVNETNGVKTFH